MENSNIKDGKTTAIVAYLSFGVIIAIFMNQDSKNKFAAFHIRQALGIDLGFILIGTLVGGFDSWFITIPFWMFFFIFWFFGFLGAIQGKFNLVPVVGEYFQKWFQTLIS